MPIIRSDKAPAKMENNTVDEYGNGQNVFLVDKVKSYVASYSLINIIPDAARNLKPVGIFTIADLQSNHTSRKPIATMEPDLVHQLLSTGVRGRVMFTGGDFHLMVKKVVLPRLSDFMVRKYVWWHSYEAIASLLHAYGQHAGPFVNRMGRNYSDNYYPMRECATRIYMKKAPEAPKPWIPVLYKFGVHFGMV